MSSKRVAAKKLAEIRAVLERHGLGLEALQDERVLLAHLSYGEYLQLSHDFLLYAQALRLTDRLPKR